MSPNHWDHRFLAIADEVAGWSKDPRRLVGAVVVSPDRRQVAWGYNGFPPGIEDTPERLNDKDLKNQLMLHAEENALANAAVSVRGWTLYVTSPPCTHCALVAISKGIVRVVSPPVTSDKSSWYLSHLQAQSLLREAGVVLTLVPQSQPV